MPKTPEDADVKHQAPDQQAGWLGIGNWDLGIQNRVLCKLLQPSKPRTQVSGVDSDRVLTSECVTYGDINQDSSLDKAWSLFPVSPHSLAFGAYLLRHCTTMNN